MTNQTTPDAVPTAAPQLASVPTRRRWGHVLFWLLLVVGAGSAVGAGAYAISQGDPETDPAPTKASLSVNTAHPTRKTLVRTIEQPGSILPDAQAELYAKTSGYLVAIGREINAEVVASLLAQSFLNAATPAPPAAHAAGNACAAAAAWWRGPPLNIGARVTAGDVLMSIEVPERRQDVVEREAFVRQREEELSQAKTIIGTSEAAIEVAKAHKVHAEADVKRYQSDHTFRMKELARIKELVRDRVLQPNLEDEKQSQVDTAKAAWESSQAKMLSAQADLVQATSKLATARADVRVKEALLNVARADLERARIIVEYAQLHAPFSGIITYRGVDEGDFVQNSRTGQSRHLMTVTALDKVKVSLKVPSREGVLVRVGAEAVVTVDSRPGEQFHGRVSRTRRMLDAQSRTLEVEIDLDNRHQKLMPGMYGHVTLTLATMPNTWTIPAAALFSRNKVNYILLVRDGVAHRQAVRITFDDGDQVGAVKLIKGKEVPLDGSEEMIISSKGEIADGQRVQSPTSTKP